MRLVVNYGQHIVNDISFILAPLIGVNEEDSISFSTERPYYIQSNTNSLSLPPAKSDLELEKDCYYLLSLDINEVQGSVILFLLFYDGVEKINTIELVIHRGHNSILFNVPSNYMSCKMSFRVMGKGHLSFKKCVMDKKLNVIETISILFNSAFENNDRRLINYYYWQMKLFGLHDFDLNTYKNFLLSAFALDSEDYINSLIDYLNKDSLFKVLSTDVTILKNINAFRIKYLNNSTAMIHDELKNKGIRNYVTNIITSGFGDILTVGNMVSYFCEQLGLDFAGVFDLKKIATYKKHYIDLMRQIGLVDCQNDKKIYYITIDNIQEDLTRLLSEIKNLTIGKFDTLCLVSKTPNSFSGLKVNDDFNKNMCNNGFHKYFITQVRRSKLFDVANKKQRNISLTIHLRLGDVAAVKIKEFVVVPFDIQNDRYNTGFSNVTTIDKSSQLYSHYMLLNDVIQFIEEVRKTHKNIQLNLITDGYSATRSKLKQNNIVERLLARGVDYNVNDVDVIIDKYEETLRSMSFDVVSIGDNTSQDFINSVNTLINSDIIISSSRSFVFNILSNFKYDHTKKHIFYTNLRGGYFESLKSNNVELEDFVSFNALCNKVNNRLKALNNEGSLDYNNIVNISPYSYFYTSSIGEWEKQKSGSPLDGSSDKSRYSFHTMKEDNPFIVVYFKEGIIVETLEIIFRDKYSDQVVPLNISVSIDGINWQDIDVITTPKEKYTNKYLFTYGAIKYLRVQREGYGYLFLSSINIFIHKTKFLMQMKQNDNSVKTIFVYSPFYGLGGRLETLASAFGYLQKSDFKHILVDWGANKVLNLLEYPFQIDYRGSNKDLIMRSLNPSVAAQLLSLKAKCRTERNISHWRAPSLQEANHHEAIFISRDSLGEFVGKKEHLYSCMQRLYKNIIPSSLVLQRVVDIERNHHINNYNNAVGIQVRHGNGEKYYNPNSKQWGVKPPKKSEIIATIKNFLDITSLKIETIILASDCSAVKDIIDEEFKERFNIIFISDFIQPVGSGCNHLPSVFSTKAVRIDINQEIDEINNFAEIICLSRCAGLIGGKSYFFNSIIGYSNCDPQNIMRINNNDRYITLDEDLIPLENAGDDDSRNILDLFSKYNILSDGIFIRNLSQSNIQINYFDIILFSDAISHLEMQISEIFKILQENRLY